MRKLKQALSLSLALVLSLTLAAPAFAAGTTETAVDGLNNITMTVYNVLKKGTGSVNLGITTEEVTIYVVDGKSIIVDMTYDPDTEVGGYSYFCWTSEGIFEDLGGGILGLEGRTSWEFDPHNVWGSVDTRPILMALGDVWLMLESDYAVVAAATGQPTTPTQPEQPTASNGAQISDWSKEQVNKALNSNLVPDGLGNDYRVNITRAQFAAASVKLYEAMSSQTAPAAGNSPFTDTSDPAVIQAQALGFVSGIGGGKFAPDSLVTREQAAAMLSRVYTKLGGNIPAVTATTFADNGSVSGWARDSVAFMADKGIVNGVGDNTFAPRVTPALNRLCASPCGCLKI